MNTVGEADNEQCKGGGKCGYGEGGQEYAILSGRILCAAPRG